ncbi:MAG: hypothetical protein M3R38_17680 [Actinomycetota bacterium]|nr:hypothetical protein [Actinomycetota bacterium]
MTNKPPLRVLARYDPPIARTILLGAAGGLVLTPEEILMRGGVCHSPRASPRTPTPPRRAE